MAKGNDRNSGYERDPYDFYVEDEPCVRSLFEAIPWFRGTFPHDPCCGSGTIPRVAASMGFDMTGADLIDRCAGRYSVRDFLTDTARYPAIVTNPPYSHAEDVVRHALHLVVRGGLVAAVARSITSGRSGGLERPRRARRLIGCREEPPRLHPQSRPGSRRRLIAALR